MNTIYKIGVIIAGIFMMSGCQDFLEENPKGALFEDQLNTPEVAEGFVTAAYSALDGYFTGSAATPQNPRYGDWGFNAALTNWSFSDVRADDAYKGGGGTGDQGGVHAMEICTEIFTTNNDALRRWRVLYAAVKRCNDAINTLNKLTDDQLETRTERIGEMHFLRGHFYFLLKITFNRIPWIDETMSAEEAKQVSNTALSSEELWAKIEADFKAAKAVLPLIQNDHKGRATKGAATSYLAKTYLFQQKYQEALSEIDLVVNSGQYRLMDDYTQLWQIEFENDKESIFAIQHSIKDGTVYGNVNWSYLLNTPPKPKRGIGYNGGDGFFQASQNAVNVYKTSEKGLPLFDTFNNSDVTDMSDSSIDVSKTDRVDPRLDHNIGRPGIMWLDMDEYNDTWVRDVNTYGPFYVKKGLLSVNSPYILQGWPWSASALNWYIIRYADVLLWKAECLIETGGSLEEARQLINQIRNRAKQSLYVQKKDMSGPGANYLINEYPAEGWTQEYARKALRFERRLELIYEGHRFFDLVRWGIAAETINSYFAVEKTKRNYYVSANFTKGTHEYMPIPQGEMDLNPSYEQNPNY